MYLNVQFLAAIALCLGNWLQAQDISLPTSPFTHSINGLQIEVREYREFCAKEWQLRIQASPDKEQPIYSAIPSADFEIVLPDESWLLHWNKGSHAGADDFQPQTTELPENQNIKLESFGGRSSDGTLPYFNLASRSGGMILAIGWSGDWQATFDRHSGGRLHVRAGLKRSNFRLKPLEQVRLPGVLLMTYQGDWLNGQNQFRQLMLKHFTPSSHTPMKLMPVAASVHGMLGFNDTNEEKLIAIADELARLKLPIDTFWLDAGWNEGGFPVGQGNPHPDRLRFPRGLNPVGQAAHAAGLRFLTWFEPERAMRGSWLTQEHSDWLLKPTATPPELRYMENDGFMLLNLGQEPARRWAIDTISQQITDFGVDIYRQDFNEYPAYFWHTHEAADEVGLREVRYITGLYEFMDELRRRHPNVILDNCASGGRRLDFEMMRRSVSLWRSDSCWDDAKFPRNVQCMTHGLSLWLPLHGLGALGTDPIALRSGMGACASFPINYRDLESVRRLGAHLDRYLKIRSLYSADFYSLTQWSDDPKQWLAFQFYDPENGRGLVQAFRGPDASPPAARIQLRGLEPSARYAVTNWDQAQEVTYTGSELMSNGLPLPTNKEAQAVVIEVNSVDVKR